MSNWRQWGILGASVNKYGKRTVQASYPSSYAGTSNNSWYLSSVEGYKISPIAGLMPAEAGADVTGQNTAKDTAAVNGTAAATVSQGAGRANAAIDSSNIVVAGGIDFSRSYTGKHGGNIPASSTIATTLDHAFTKSSPADANDATAIPYSTGGSVDSLKPAEAGAVKNWSNVVDDTGGKAVVEAAGKHSVLFDMASEPPGWTHVGTSQIVTGAGVTGANVLELTGWNYWRYFNNHDTPQVPFDSTKLYRVRFRIRVTVDSTTTQQSTIVGIDTIGATGAIVGSSNGQLSIFNGLQYAADGWVEYEMWISGTSAANTLNASTPDNPSTLITTAVAFSPGLFVNHNTAGNDQVTQVDMASIDVFDASGHSRLYSGLDGTGAVQIDVPPLHVKYTGGATLDSLKPAESGADVTGSHTANDTSNVNGVGAATVQGNAQDGHDLTVSGSGKYLGSGLNLFSLNSAGYATAYWSGITFTPGPGSMAISAGTLHVGGETVSYNSSGITGQSYSTTYSYFYQDIGYTGGSKTLKATTSKQTLISNDGYIYIGDGTTQSSGGTGGGGGATTCVAFDMFIRPNVPAVMACVGQKFDAYDKFKSLGERTLLNAWVATGTGVRITTSNGSVLDCGEDTPFDLKDGTSKLAKDMLGETVITDEGEDPVISVKNLGVIPLVYVSGGGLTIMAGADPKKRIGSHNTQKP